MIKNLRPIFSTTVVVLALLCLVNIVPVAAYGVSPDVVISQVYGGGGNTGATFKNDFIELFNRGTSTVSLAGWSVQYASSTGSSWQVTPLVGSIAPGQHYLIKEAAGAGGTTDLPTPDATGTGSGIAMAAGAGKVALVNNTTVLSGTCPTGASIVDFAGYGTGTNCFEGTGPTATLSNTTAALRKAAGATDTDNNNTDFAVGAPNPRNTAATLSGVGSSTPGSVAVGDTVTLQVVVTPAINPTSTGISVTGNLSAIGGSSTQTFFDDGTHGDAVAGDNTFTFQATVAPGTATGTANLPISLLDLQIRTGATNIALLITLPGTSLAIHEIQGAGSSSPYVGQLVNTTGIVTAVKTNGFFIQAPDAEDDADPSTSEGLFIFTSSAPPAAAAVGNLVKARGTVAEFKPSTDPLSFSSTELASPVVFLLSTGNALPAAIALTAADFNPAGGPQQLEKYQGMRVSVASLDVVAPTQGSITEPSATVSSTGIFFGVISGTARPFREPGIQVPENTLFPAGPPVFDGNPEKLRVDSDAQVGAAVINVATGATVTGLVGVLDYLTHAYTLIPDPSLPPSVTGGMSVAPVPVPGAHEVTVASMNMERFFDTTDDPSTSDAVLTPAAFAKRLNKASLLVRNVLNMPDIIGVEEMENLSTLEAVATKINSDAVADGKPDPQYTAYLEEGNDIGGIDVGFLVKSTRVEVVDVTQYGKDTTYTNPVNNQQEILNDRPPLVLHATVKGTQKELPLAMTVIVNHLRSLTGIDDADGRVRAKRLAQAEYLANLIQGFQASGEKVISVGDYNALSVNDGFVDVMAVVMGLPATADVAPEPNPAIVAPALTDLVTTLPPNQQYSYSFDGDAQVLDHILINDGIKSQLSKFAYARDDADFPTIYYADGNRPERLSDHDQPVAYFTVPTDEVAPVLSLPSDITVLAAGPAGTVVSYTATATDNIDGATQVSCTPASGATFAIGTTTVNCSSTDAHSNTATGSFNVHVVYGFSGFASPLGGGVSGPFKSGSTVPVKWQLSFSDGTLVTSTAVVQSVLAALNSDCAGGAEGVPFTPASVGGGVRYDPVAKQFIFNWKTSSTLGANCYNLTIGLNDQTTETAIVSLK